MVTHWAFALRSWGTDIKSRYFLDSCVQCQKYLIETSLWSVILRTKEASSNVCIVNSVNLLFLCKTDRNLAVFSLSFLFYENKPNMFEVWAVRQTKKSNVNTWALRNCDFHYFLTFYSPNNLLITQENNQMTIWSLAAALICCETVSKAYQGGFFLQVLHRTATAVGPYSPAC